MYQEEVKSAIILLYLGILAGMDVRKRQISLVLTGVLFLTGIGWQILVEQTSWLEWLLSLLPHNSLHSDTLPAFLFYSISAE